MVFQTEKMVVRYDQTEQRAPSFCIH
jgi:hypothetical protein